MKLIDGKAAAERINEETRAKVEELKRRGIIPGLAVVLVGDDPASAAYVRNKDKTSKELGFYSKKNRAESRNDAAGTPENRG